MPWPTTSHRVCPDRELAENPEDEETFQKFPVSMHKLNIPPGGPKMAVFRLVIESVAQMRWRHAGHGGVPDGKLHTCV